MTAVRKKRPRCVKNDRDASGNSEKSWTFPTLAWNTRNHFNEAVTTHFDDSQKAIGGLNNLWPNALNF